MREFADFTRCGNTSYYRAGEGLNWLYVDPFNWQMISSTMAKTGSFDEGALSVIYRKAPRYDFDEAKYGVSLISEDENERQVMLRAIHEWFADLNRVKGIKMKDAEVKKLFNNAPKEMQSHVLNAIRGMMAAYEEDDMLREGGPSLETKVILVIPRGSKAENNLDGIQELYQGELVSTLIEDSVYEGLEKALSDLGIYEC